MVWYFAYGSNLDPDRLRARVGEWAERRRARLSGWRLAFSARVTSEGGGGAVIEPCEGAVTYGAAFALTQEQLATLDDTEFDESRDTATQGTRVTVDVEIETDDGSRVIQAEAYTLRPDSTASAASTVPAAPAPTARRAPSPRYLGHILRGLRDLGHDDEVVEEVRRIAYGSSPGSGSE